MNLQNTKVHAGNFTKRVQEKLQSLGITFISGETETLRAKCDFIYIYYKVFRVKDDLDYFISHEHKEVSISDILSIELPKKEPKKFKVGQKVLVRDCKNLVWEIDLFQYPIGRTNDYNYQCLSAVWKYCIPLKGNRKLHHTTNNN